MNVENSSVAQSRLLLLVFLAATTAILPSCGSVQPAAAPVQMPPPVATEPIEEVPATIPEVSTSTKDEPEVIEDEPEVIREVVAEVVMPATLVEVPVVVTSKIRSSIPKGARIVVSNIDGDCSEEVKDALMRRLINNRDYSVLGRDYLGQILGESKLAWEGEFNTATAVKFGELLGASLFIVGRVIYCGPVRDSQRDTKGEINILAVLQIIDITTGKVIVSSASDGAYIPGSPPLLQATSEEVVYSAELSTNFGSTEDSKEISDTMKNSPSEIGSASVSVSLTPEARGGAGENENENRGRRDYPTVQAADDLANEFADKFFARPTWESVEMWKNPLWHYGDSVRYVKLGRCPAAVTLLESVAVIDLPHMPEPDVARFLHNYGVALLCANNPELAMRKLRSAYRISYSKTTEDMLALAGRLLEWDLNVEVDVEPETKSLLDRSIAPHSNPTCCAASSPKG